VRSLQYSYYKKSLLGCCSDSGTVALWDTNTRQMVHSFDEHAAPALGLAFSPVNETLLMSVGLDKKLVCYDTGSKK
jgi:protein NEDD1